MSTREPDQRFTPKLSRPARDALNEAGYFRLEELNGVPAKELLRLHGMGPKGIRILREALHEQGMAFGDE